MGNPDLNRDGIIDIRDEGLESSAGQIIDASFIQIRGLNISMRGGGRHTTLISRPVYEDLRAIHDRPPRNRLFTVPMIESLRKFRDWFTGTPLSIPDPAQTDRKALDDELSELNGNRLVVRQAGDLYYYFSGNNYNFVAPSDDSMPEKGHQVYKLGRRFNERHLEMPENPELRLKAHNDEVDSDFTFLNPHSTHQSYLFGDIFLFQHGPLKDKNVDPRGNSTSIRVGKKESIFDGNVSIVLVDPDADFSKTGVAIDFTEKPSKSVAPARENFKEQVDDDLDELIDEAILAADQRALAAGEDTEEASDQLIDQFIDLTFVPELPNIELPEIESFASTGILHGSVMNITNGDLHLTTQGNKILETEEDTLFFTETDLIILYRDFLVLNHDTFTSFKYADAEEFTAGPLEGSQWGTLETVKMGNTFDKNLSDNQSYNFATSRSLANSSTSHKKEDWGIMNANLSATGFSEALTSASIGVTGLGMAASGVSLSQTGAEVHLGGIKERTQYMNIVKPTDKVSRKGPMNEAFWSGADKSANVPLLGKTKLISHGVPIVAGLAAAGTVAGFGIRNGIDIGRTTGDHKRTLSDESYDATEPTRAFKRASVDTDNFDGDDISLAEASDSSPDFLEEIVDVSVAKTPLTPATSSKKLGDKRNKFLIAGGAIGVIAAIYGFATDKPTDDATTAHDEGHSDDTEPFPEDVPYDPSEFNDVDYNEGAEATLPPPNINDEPIDEENIPAIQQPTVPTDHSMPNEFDESAIIEQANRPSEALGGDPLSPDTTSNVGGDISDSIAENMDLEILEDQITSLPSGARVAPEPSALSHGALTIDAPETSSPLTQLEPTADDLLSDIPAYDSPLTDKQSTGSTKPSATEDLADLTATPGQSEDAPLTPASELFGSDDVSDISFTPVKVATCVAAGVAGIATTGAVVKKLNELMPKHTEPSEDDDSVPKLDDNFDKELNTPNEEPRSIHPDKPDGGS